MTIDINKVRVQLDSDDIIDHIELHANLKPILTTFLDRLEAAEKAVTEAYQRGYATGQEEIEKERDELRAKVAGLVPIGLLHVGGYYGEELQDWEFEADQQACDRLNEAHFQREATLNLYALPGVKGEEK